MEQLRHRRTAVAAEIRAELARQNVSLPRLADGAGLGVHTLRRRLQGTRPFTTDELDSITSYLGIQLSTLIERAEAS